MKTIISQLSEEQVSQLPAETLETERKYELIETLSKRLEDETGWFHDAYVDGSITNTAMVIRDDLMGGEQQTLAEFEEETEEELLDKVIQFLTTELHQFELRALNIPSELIGQGFGEMN